MVKKEESASHVPSTTSGTLYAFTTVYSGPVGIETPYQLGWVDAQGERVFTRLLGTPRLGCVGTLRWVEHEGWWFECAP